MMTNVITIVMTLIQMLKLLFFQRQLGESNNFFPRYVQESCQCVNVPQIWLSVYVLRI